MQKETREIKIINPNGLHLRVASKVVTICKEGQSKVTVECGQCPKADGCSILSLIRLGAGAGDLVRITAEGQDAREVVERLSDYFSDGGGI